jgi:hypothetical protein
MTLFEKEVLQCEAEFYELDELYSLVSGLPAPTRFVASPPPARSIELISAIAKPLRKVWADLDRRHALWD